MSGSINGISSGMDTDAIIDAMMGVKRQQVERLQLKKETELSKKDAWTTIQSNLITLQLSAYTLSRETTFNAKSASVSDATVLSATAGRSAVEGDYSFYVQQLAAKHQLTTNGFYDYDKTTVGSGSISFETAAAKVVKDVNLSSLNGGQGVDRGIIKITDRDGNSSNIDLTKAMSIQDVIDKINKNTTINVTATVANDGLGFDLADGTGGSGTFSVSEVDGSTASDLGILQSEASDILYGSNVYYLTSSSSLELLNDGLGVDKGTFNINDTSVDISSAMTIGDVVSAINDAGTGATASLRADGLGITLSGTVTSVTEDTGSAAAGLGLFGMTETGDGSDVLAGMNSVLLKNLNGGAGISGATILINGQTVDLSSASTLQEAIKLINDEFGSTAVSASYNSLENGIKLSSSAPITVAEGDGTIAADLGLAIGVSTGNSVTGADLDLQYIGANTRLSSLNFGSGIRSGDITITNKDGEEFTFDVSEADTIGDVLAAINADSATSNITATINAKGDGLLITDTTGGSGNLIVAEDGSGHFAEDLGIKGSVTGATIDGSFEQSIIIANTDSLEDIRDAVNDLDMGVKASIINDGSKMPYRLVFSSENSGEIGEFIYDTDISVLSMNVSAQARDAILVLGEPGSDNAVYSSSSSNKVNDFIQGVELNLADTSDSVINIKVDSNYDDVVEAANDFVEKYNTLMDKMGDQLSYDASLGEGGPLFGDTNLFMLQQDVFQMVTRSVDGGSGNVTSMMQVGFTLDTSGALGINESELRASLADDMESVVEFFTLRGDTATSAAVTVSGTDSGWNVAGLTDGNDNTSDYASGSTGWQYANGGSVELDFGKNTLLSRLEILGVGSSESDRLKSFNVEYWNRSKSAWTTYSSVSNNQSKNISMYFPTGITTSKVRLSNLQGYGGSSKILEVNVLQNQGFASYIDLALSKMTDGGTGTAYSAQDTIEDNVVLYDEQIASLEARLDIEEDRLRAAFVKMEQALNQLSSMSSWLSSQSSSLSANWRSL